MYKAKAQKHRETKKQNYQNQKMKNKNTFLHSGSPPNFCQFFLSGYTLCKAVFCWKHYKNSVFSRAQLLGITGSKTLSGPLPKMALLQPKVPFWVFPCARWNPYFYSVLSLGMATKKDHFPKTDSCNENARLFYRLNTNSVCIFF